MRNPIVEEDLQKIIATKLPWEKFAGKTVFVTGANGFLASCMVETLLFVNESLNNHKKTKIAALVRDEKKALNRFVHYLGRDDLQIIMQDVCAPIDYDGVIDFVIHAASPASPSMFLKSPVETLNTNILGTYNVLSLAREKHAESVLFFSSAQVYGQVDQDHLPICEDYYGSLDPTDVRNCYSEGKRAAEAMCSSWFHQYGIAAKIIRPFHTYGPKMNLDNGPVYADFISDLLHHRPIVLNSDGSAVRSFCYSADAVSAYFTVLLKGQSAMAYNVGNNECTMSILDLAKLLSQSLGEGRAVVVPPTKQQLQTNISISYPDISRICELGWQPGTSIIDGFQRTLSSFQYEKELSQVG